MELTLDVYIVFQAITVIVIVATFVWRLPSKGDIKRLDDRIDKLDVKLSDRIDKLDAKTGDRIDKLDVKLSDRIDKLDVKMGDRIDKLDAKVDKNFATLDSKMDDLRKETKSDIQRLEDRAEKANEYHARSVDLLDAIRRQLEERREPL